MRLLNESPPYDLTYSDVFMVPSLSSVPSRFAVDLSTPDRLGTTIPVVVSNMTAVAGRRMAETVARRGGLTVLPQDIPLDVIEAVIDYVKSRHLVYDTPITLSPTHTVGDALGLIHKRAHGALVVVGDDGAPVGDLHRARRRRIRPLHPAEERDEQRPDGDRGRHHPPTRSTTASSGQRLSVAPVVDGDGRLIGCVTRKGALRSTIYQPAVDGDGRLPHRRRRRHQRRPGHQGQVAAGDGRRRARDRHRPRPPDPHAAGHRGGARASRPTRRSWPATSSPPRARATSSTPAPTS